jgi:hypothetical protein
MGRHSPQRIACLQPDGILSWDTVRRTTSELPAAERFEHFEAWCTTNEGCDARLFVSGHLAHSLLIDPALNIVDDEAIRTYARQQFTHYHGAPARQWPLAVWADGPQSCACALHALDLDALCASAARHNVRLRSLAPLWSAGLGSLSIRVPALTDPGIRAFALVEGSLVTWLVVDAGRLHAIHQRFLDAPRVDALSTLIGQLVAEGHLLADLPVVIGWGLNDAEPGSDFTSELRARVIGSLNGDGPGAEWVLDAVRSVA